MTTESSSGVSMLSRMSAGITATAAARAPKKGLTPLPGEVTAPPIPNHPVVGTLPDDPDIILGRLADAEREVLAILESIGRLQRAWGKPEEVSAEMFTRDEKALEREADRRAAERAGDSVPLEVIGAKIEAEDRKRAEVLAAMAGAEPEPFPDRMKRLTEEAQAHTFTADSAVEGGEDPAPAPLSDGGWTCPDHGQHVTKVSPRRGREYRACPVPGCAEFEKL